LKTLPYVLPDERVRQIRVVPGGRLRQVVDLGERPVLGALAVAEHVADVAPANAKRRSDDALANEAAAPPTLR